MSGSDQAQKPLTEQEAKFVEGVLQGKSKKQAAEDAGYAAGSAGVAASRLLRRANVAAALAQRKGEVMAEIQATTGVTLKRLLEELAHIALLDPKDFFDVNGKVLPIDQMPEGARRALRSFDVHERHEDAVSSEGDILITTRSKKPVPFDKLKAIELIAKLANLLSEQVDHHVTFRWEE